MSVYCTCDIGFVLRKKCIFIFLIMPGEGCAYTWKEKEKKKPSLHGT